MKPTVRVVAAVIRDEPGRVLVNQRTPDKTHAGQWEFPGGKVEVGETDEAALRREIYEELGVRVTAARPMMAFAHEYSERHVHLSVWVVDQFTGTPVGIEGQPLLWVLPAQLRSMPLLAADLPIIEKLENSTTVT